MPRSLEGRQALVCGASRGIGRATAHALARHGARVVVLARNGEALRELTEALRAGGAGAETIVADLDDRAGLVARIDEHLARHGPIHVLINNTGGPPSGRLLDADDDALLAAFHRHVLAAHALVRRLVPGMQQDGYGRIVNVLSTSVREPIPNLGVSNTIRAAMAGWAKTLAGELPPGVTINNVLPGYTATERLDELIEAAAKRTGRAPQDIEADYVRQIPEGRLAAPEEIAAMIAFLCLPAASYVRGQSIAVDGGRLKSI